MAEDPVDQFSFLKLVLISQLYKLGGGGTYGLVSNFI